MRRKRWRVYKMRTPHDPRYPWTVTAGDWESLCANSAAASIEGGQFESQSEAFAAGLEAIRDAAQHGCHWCEWKGF